jgi:hypothetical protein
MASMSILDDAIREHLELKRAHGADESEIKRLEDEAFGPPGRPEDPDPVAEAPTEFMDSSEAPAAAEPAEEDGGRRINIADLQEPPAPAPQEEPRIEATDAVEPEPEVDAVLAPAEDPAQAALPADEELPLDDAVDVGRGTEERHAIAEQPTELFDVEAEMGTEDAPPPSVEATGPTDEEVAEAEPEAAEPKLTPVEPPTEIYAARTEAPADAAEEEEEDEDFWSEQRLSDELDQALEAPVVEEDQAPPAPTEQPPAPAEPAATSGEPEEPKQQVDYDPDTGHEDVLEDTPEFLEESPEDDELWFEQKPPKDFDFDD